MVLKTMIIILCFSAWLCAGGQETLRPQTTTLSHRIGETTVQIITQQYGENPEVVYISLHDDEQTSVLAAGKLLEQKGGLLIRLENNNKRLVRFRLNGRTYRFDPNRIFSRQGIRESLSLLGPVSSAAILETERLADRILQLMPKNISCIVALHNNTDGKFSIDSYRPGRENARDARKLHVSKSEDPDDMFLTTDSVLYQQLVLEDFNVVLQHNQRAVRDGSLSVYCGEMNIRYLNCETEHYKSGQYERMIFAAGKFIY